MKHDMTVPCGGGIINIRVGAIIMKNGKILMVEDSEDPRYLYTVGGRLKFGETSEEAVVREVYEETGATMEIDRLGFISENYSYSDKKTKDTLIYEISYFYYMKVPPDFEPKKSSFDEGKHKEYLKWINPDDPVKYYPEFFRTELDHPCGEVKFFLIDERK